MRAFVLALVALVALTGCGSGTDRDVQRTAAWFYTSLDQHDGDAACAVLAPRTRAELVRSEGMPCHRAILELPLPRQPGTKGRVRAFGTTAQVRTDTDTAFLTRIGSDWRILALGCQPAGATYECELQGG